MVLARVLWTTLILIACEILEGRKHGIYVRYLSTLNACRPDPVVAKRAFPLERSFCTTAQLLEHLQGHIVQYR